jgi:hypothetical protein
MPLKLAEVRGLLRESWYLLGCKDWYRIDSVVESPDSAV